LKNLYFVSGTVSTFLWGSTGRDDDPLEDEEMQEQVDGVFKEYSIKQFEIIYAFHGLLEAPGYMDQTELLLWGQSSRGSRATYRSLFSEDKKCMDDDELEDLAWLESIVNEGGAEDETT
jgi:hypothetical protein